MEERINLIDADRDQMKKSLEERVLSNNPESDIEKILKAFDLAYDAHIEQKRNSGEPYIMHPFEVAKILSDLNMDSSTIISGLLHDVIEDTDYSYEDISEMFGEEVAHIVDGVTKLTNLNFRSKEEKQAENTRKMVMAMSNDIRVIIVKLADRLHNMRTLEYMTEAKKKEKATEVIEIYAPLAGRLGIFKLKWELEDLALRYLDEEEYHNLASMVRKRRNEREYIIDEIIKHLYEYLEKVNIKAEISGRPKNLYSIYKKMNHKGLLFEQIYDLSAVRIIVNTVADCYGALGVVHNHYKPIPGRFKDYIAVPKSNMYQSLHTTVIDDKGETFEVQIRTHEMHEIAEYGIAAHWKYKQSGGSNVNTETHDNMTWIRQMIEWQDEESNPEQYMEGLKVDFFSDEVFVFTPTGEVISLSEGSTPIDFAYTVHTQVGHTCTGAKVNGKMVPIDYKLQNGDIVEIITDKNKGPSLDWLGIVKSPKAKNKIKQYFKSKDREKNIDLGKEMITYDINKARLNPKDVLKKEWLEDMASKYAAKSVDDLFSLVGFGDLTSKQISGKLITWYREMQKEKLVEYKEAIKPKKKSDKNAISIEGVDGLKLKIAGCCNPVPGDDIVGFVTRGRGITVHRSDCHNITEANETERILRASWENEEDNYYNASILIKGLARTGFIADVTTKVANSGVKINGIDARVNDEQVTELNATLEIKNKQELNKILDSLKNIEGIIDVRRISG